jgi:hypothetical protein
LPPTPRLLAAFRRYRGPSLLKSISPRKALKSMPQASDRFVGAKIPAEAVIANAFLIACGDKQIQSRFFAKGYLQVRNVWL